jgi:uncharacterized Zn finger protein
VQALVSGSSLYKVTIKIKNVQEQQWRALKQECSGKIASLIGLLQGKLPEPVMQAVTREKTGLFPEARDIKFDCSCPDYADICKHVAAVVYGVGTRLDHRPELLFLLRGVDHLELIEGAGDAVAAQAAAGAEAKTSLADISDIFGIELDGAPQMAVVVPSAAKATASKRSKDVARKKLTVKKPVLSSRKLLAELNDVSKASRKLVKTPALQKPAKPSAVPKKRAKKATRP